MKLQTLITLAALTSSSLFAQTVTVKDAWARATVQGQKATGVFMKINVKDGAKLVNVSSPVAGVSEVREMKMDGDIMRMRAVDGGLDLPAGQTVELKPGGFHVMLMDIKASLKKDTIIAVTLVFKDAKGVDTTLVAHVPVASQAPKAK